MKWKQISKGEIFSHICKLKFWNGLNKEISFLLCKYLIALTNNLVFHHESGFFQKHKKQLRLRDVGYGNRELWFGPSCSAQILGLQAFHASEYSFPLLPPAITRWRARSSQKREMRIVLSFVGPQAASGFQDKDTNCWLLVWTPWQFREKTWLSF